MGSVADHLAQAVMPDDPTLSFIDRFMVLLNLIAVGEGDPEGVVTAEVGSLYFRLDGGVGSTLYTKQAGPGDTGWAPYSAGALFVRKTANEVVNNSNVAQNDDQLLLAVEANAVYILDAFIIYEAVTAADLHIKFTGPVGATLDWASFGLSSVASALTGDMQAAQRTIAQVSNLGAITGSKGAARPSGLLVVGETAGTLQFQWAQNNTDASDATVYANSWLRLIRVS